MKTPPEFRTFCIAFGLCFASSSAYAQSTEQDNVDAALQAVSVLPIDSLCGLSRITCRSIALDLVVRSSPRPWPANPDSLRKAFELTPGVDSVGKLLLPIHVRSFENGKAGEAEVQVRLILLEPQDPGGREKRFSSAVALPGSAYPFIAIVTLHRTEGRWAVANVRVSES